GMGAGLILNGQLYCGADDMAGEVGHVRVAPEGPAGYGKQGSFEGFCSGGGLAQLGRSFALEALQRGERPSYCPDFAALQAVTARSLAEAAQAGDPTAQAVWRRCGDYLGRGLALLVDVLNPQAIVIGSIYARSGELLRGAMEAALGGEALPHSRRNLRILPAALGERLGDMAALAVAANGLMAEGGN
ncbi:MAG: ROK family protein, partial [Christensenellales bacterium]